MVMTNVARRKSVAKRKSVVEKRKSVVAKPAINTSIVVHPAINISTTKTHAVVDMVVDIVMEQKREFIINSNHKFILCKSINGI